MSEAAEVRARGAVTGDGRLGFAPAPPGPRRRFIIRLTGWGGGMADVEGSHFSIGTRGELMIIDSMGKTERVYAPGVWISLLVKDAASPKDEAG